MTRHAHRPTLRSLDAECPQTTTSSSTFHPGAWLGGVLTLVALLALVGCGKKDTSSAPAKGAEATKTTAKGAPQGEDEQAEKEKPLKPIDRGMLGAFKALPKNFDSATNPGTPAKIRLGQMLYFDKRLSRSGTISCNSCHDLNKFGVDYESTSPGHDKKLGGRNSPTVFNAAGHFRQFWDGREPDVEAQAKGPVLNPVEHGLKDAAEVEKILSNIPGYVAMFQRAFPEDGDKAITFDNFGKAVGAFERRLVTPAPWDSFLAGDDKALTQSQKIGARLFVETGCVACHNGALLGGRTYQKLGKVKPWPRAADEGRKTVTGKAEDRHLFKVPSLRNVAKTMPYFHDGKTMELREAVQLMAIHQLGKKLGEDEVKLIESFLESLTGQISERLTRRPTLPASKGVKEGMDKDAAPTKAKVVKRKAPKKRADVVPKAPPSPDDAPPPPLPPADHVPPPPEK